MAFCKHCGTKLPEGDIRFCSTCGGADPLSSEVSKSVRQDCAAESNNNVFPPKQFDFTWFNNNFYVIFVTLGLSAMAFMQFTGVFILFSYGVSIVFGVITILLALGCAAVTVIRFCVSDKKGNGTRHSATDGVCLSVGLIELVFVLTMTIVLMVMGSDAGPSLLRSI